MNRLLRFIIGLILIYGALQGALASGISVDWIPDVVKSVLSNPTLNAWLSPVSPYFWLQAFPGDPETSRDILLFASGVQAVLGIALMFGKKGVQVLVFVVVYVGFFIVGLQQSLTLGQWVVFAVVVVVSSVLGYFEYRSQRG